MYTHFGYAYEEKQVTYNERLAMSLSAVCIYRSSEVDAQVTILIGPQRSTPWSLRVLQLTPKSAHPPRT